MANEAQLESKMSQGSNAVSQISNAAKLGADMVLLPGTSYLVDGKLLPGVIASAGGIIARSFFGPLGWASVGLASYCLNRLSGTPHKGTPMPQPSPETGEQQR
jgi:hypothetical protein